MIEQFQFLLSFIATRGPPLGTKLKIGLLKGKQTSCQLQENNLGLKLFLISPSRICLSAWHIWLNGRKWKSNNKVWPIQQSSAVFRLLQDGQRISFLFLTHNNFPQMVQLLSTASRQDTRREISNTIFEFSKPPASNLLFTVRTSCHEKNWASLVRNEYRSWPLFTETIYEHPGSAANFLIGHEIAPNSKKMARWRF